MAVVGEPDQWADVFPSDMVPEILDIITAAWLGCPKPAPEQLENKITLRLLRYLRGEKNSRRLPVSVRWESTIVEPDAVEVLGRVDIIWSAGHREEVYLAFECKRLRVPAKRGARVRSYASEYVNDGMMRFVVGTYARGLAHGGMIGYVMDGKIPLAMKAVDNAIRKKQVQLRQREPAGLNESSLRPNSEQVRETTHRRVAKDVTLHHVFLGV